MTTFDTRRGSFCATACFMWGSENSSKTWVPFSDAENVALTTAYVNNKDMVEFPDTRCTVIFDAHFLYYEQSFDLGSGIGVQTTRSAVNVVYHPFAPEAFTRLVKRQNFSSVIKALSHLRSVNIAALKERTKLLEAAAIASCSASPSASASSETDDWQPATARSGSAGSSTDDKWSRATKSWTLSSNERNLE